MLKGGYQIIDLKGRELQIGVGSFYEGIYDLIEGTNKPIVVSGLNVEGVDIRDDFASVKIMDTNFDLIVGNYVVTVNDRDVVTIYYERARINSTYDSDKDKWTVDTSNDTMKKIAKSPLCFPIYIPDNSGYSVACSRQDNGNEVILTYTLTYSASNIYIHKITIYKDDGNSTIESFTV